MRVLGDYRCKEDKMALRGATLSLNGANVHHRLTLPSHTTADVCSTVCVGIVSWYKLKQFVYFFFFSTKNCCLYREINVTFCIMDIFRMPSSVWTWTPIMCHPSPATPYNWCTYYTLWFCINCFLNDSISTIPAFFLLPPSTEINRIRRRRKKKISRKCKQKNLIEKQQNSS